MGRPLAIATALVAALVLGSGVGLASASPLPGDLPLVYGDRGDTVHKAHYRLNWLGYDLRTKEVDNDFFGRSTKVAVKNLRWKFLVSLLVGLAIYPLQSSDT